MELKNIIKELRKKNNLTQAEVGEAIGVSPDTIRSYEAGRREPSSQNMVALERFFNVSGAFLRGEVEDQELSKYEDPTIIKEIDDVLSPLANKIIELAKADTDENRELCFNILVEIKSIFGIKNPQNKTMILDLVASSIHSLNNNVNRYSEEDKTQK